MSFVVPSQTLSAAMNKIAAVPALGILAAMVYLLTVKQAEDSVQPSNKSSANLPRMADVSDQADAPLPRSVAYQEIAPDKHSYTVDGIYNPLNKDEYSEGFASIYRNIVPHCTGFQVDYPGLKCTFTTSRKLETSDLAPALDEMARIGGEVPAFAELRARDIPESPLGSKIAFSMSADNGQTSGPLDWVRMPEEGELRLPVVLGASGPGTLLIVPSTAHCMIHSRFVIRFLDSDGLVIWKDGENAYGTIEIAMQPADGKPLKLFLHRNNHGMEDDFLFQQTAISPSP